MISTVNKYLFILFFLGIFGLAGISQAATYYISTTGFDSNPGTSDQPWKTFASSFSKMTGGDTLIVKNGAYTEVIYNPPSGTAGAYTVIKAENDGGAIIDAKNYYPDYPKRAFGLQLETNYVRIEGFLFKNGGEGVGLIGGNYNELKRVGMFGDVTNNGEYLEVLSVPGSHNLIEDFWGAGGGRYVIDVGSQYNILRRIFTRWDAYVRGTRPTAGIVFYDGQNNVLENWIAIDSATPPSYEPYGMFYGKGTAGNNRIYGAIALNNPSTWYSTFWMGEWDGGDKLINSVAWNTVGTGVVLGSSGALNSLVDRVTINGRNPQINSVGNLTTAKNSIFLNGGAVNGNNFSYNIYYNNPSSGGIGALTANPNLLYPVRVEITSNAYQSGEGGVSRGANILKRYQNEVETAIDLWPWPNEDRIKQEMCAGVTRGWCGTNKTLTAYIWEYLGNPCPVGICTAGVSDTVPPAAPTGLTVN